MAPPTPNLAKGFDNNDEEVEVYVSPRRFMGRTPGPRVTRQRIFDEEVAEQEEKEEEERQKQSNHSNHEIELEMGEVRYSTTNVKEPDASVHRSVARNNCISKLVLFSNILLCLVGVAVICMSIYLISRVRNGGIAAYLFREGLLVKSVAALAFIIFCGGLLSIIAGFMYGIRQVAPSIIEGMSVDERRRGLMWYLATTLFAVLFLGLGMFASVIPAHTISKTLTDATWRSMCRSHPDRICRYEVHNRCAGVTDLQCTSSSASSNVACPGHYCALGCKAGTKQAVSGTSCARCVSVFQRGDLLGKCRTSEANKQFAGGCGRRLRAELTTFFRVAIYAGGVGLSTIAVTSITSTAALFMCISEG